MLYNKKEFENKLSEWEEKLSMHTLPMWDELPVFELYMDQVIVLVNKYLSILENGEERVLTPSMINNYVKQKTLPAPIKKRYSRVHVAYLIMICILKQSLSISMIQKILPVEELGENISDIVENFPYWFCRNYFKYTKENQSDVFDQHYLLASIAPRFVIIGSCDMDFWADPESQQLCCLAASPAWEKNGFDGISDAEDYLPTGEALTDGRVGYFKIHSKHFFSRHSWKRSVEFIEKHKQ